MSIPEQPIRPKSMLEDQIGAVYDLYPEDPKQQAIVRLLEEFFTDDPPGVRTAKWIDDLPAEQPPAPPEILPVIPEDPLLYRCPLVHAHWAAFQTRNPRTGKFFRELGLAPLKYGDMPGSSARQFTFRQRDRFEHGDVQFASDPSEQNRLAYLQLLLNHLVLYDILLARGGPNQRGNAREILSFTYNNMPGLSKFDNSRDLQHAIADELFWPHIVPEQCTDQDISQMTSAFARDEEIVHRLSIGKWVVNKKVSCTENHRMGILIGRLNAYGKANDFGGLFVICHALYPNWPADELMKTNAFVKRFGEETGRQKLADYRKLVAE